MNFKIHYFLFSFIILFNITAKGFNITKILSEYSDFSTFNSYLNQTGLSKDINSRETITVLAVSNSNISPLSGKSGNVLKSLMSVHVVLDYYDLKRLQNIPNKTITLTTLFQSSGKALRGQGFLNATVAKGTTDVKISSDATGSSSAGASLVGSVFQQPYNISVLHISNVIVPQGMDNSTSPAPTPAQAPSPSPRKHHDSPPAPPPSDSPSPSDADSPSSDSQGASNSPPRLCISLEAVLLLVSSVVMLVVAMI